MVVNTNILALNAHRNLGAVGNAQSKASQRLSSGMRINSAADDAAGLAISEKMRAQVRGLDMAAKNAQDGISLIQTAEGSMQEIGSMTQRIRELTVQAANDTNTAEDRGKIANEISQLTSEITDMATRTQFNTKTLATGAYGTGGDELHLQVGANASQQIGFSIGTLTAEGLGIASLASAIGSAGATSSSISALLSTVDEAVATVTNERAKLGAVQNRLEHTINNLQTSGENLSASESRIRDTDMAKEMMNLTKANVLQQAATSILAQANQAPQSILKLLG
ncbi:MAG: flagellin [Clostridiales bacterium]|nr:flagellin [Clostridiales bacterium]